MDTDRVLCNSFQAMMKDEINFVLLVVRIRYTQMAEFGQWSRFA